MSKTAGRISFFVDRIEGGSVVLTTDGAGEARTVTLPRMALPDVREGDWLRASFEPDPEKKSRVRGEIDKLMNG
jgi:hypothetical protein